MNFIVVEAYPPYIAILARPWLHALGAVLSTMNLKVKYPTKGASRGIGWKPGSDKTMFSGCY